MRSLAAFVLAVVAASSLFAQNRGGVTSPAPAVRPAAHFAFPSGSPPPPPASGNTVVSPPSIVIPTGINPNSGFRNGSGFSSNRSGYRGTGRSTGPVYAYPIYVGGGGYGYGYDSSYYGPQQAAPQQGSVTVIYPPQPAPVIINQFGPPGDSQYTSVQGPVQSQMSEPPDSSANEPAHYLIAFKDHTIYSAVAYWIDGDTLHYFTNGNTHNQVSVALIDRELTARLNKDSGVEIKLPPAK
ncbi:conserved exported hypothetical protein [Candidatus Sulfopaludibacter sp. SbA4]|nr:conserved exported hypothetical protein [Candidatus Sulfopaludibacter sp. SbA4]